MIGTRFTVVYDACVLYPAPLRDLLMNLALTDLFRAKWSNLIHEEWMTNVFKNRSNLSRAQLERTRDLMNISVPDALVCGFEYLIPVLTLPDPKDRHVLAAAIFSEAQVIVTYNLKDFPKTILSTHGIEPQHPDDFITNLIGLNAETVISAMKIQRQSLKNPPKSVPEYLDTLGKQNLPETLKLISKYSYCL